MLPKCPVPDDIKELKKTDPTAYHKYINDRYRELRTKSDDELAKCVEKVKEKNRQIAVNRKAERLQQKINHLQQKMEKARQSMEAIPSILGE